MCFIGHIEFNLAVLKYFDLSKIQLNINIFDGIYDKIVETIEGAMQKVRDWVDNLSFNPIEVVITILSRLEGLIQPVLDLISNAHDKLLALPGAIKRTVDEGLERVLGFFENAISSLLDFQRSALRWLTDKIQGALDDVGKAVLLVLDAVDWLFEAPLRAIQALGNAVSSLISAAQRIFEAVKQFAQEVLSFIVDFPDWLNFPKISFNLISLEDIYNYLLSIVDTLQGEARQAALALLQALQYVYAVEPPFCFELCPQSLSLSLHVCGSLSFLATFLPDRFSISISSPSLTACASTSSIRCKIFGRSFKSCWKMSSRSRLVGIAFLAL